MTVDLSSRKANFERFLEERMPVLVEFATVLGSQEPHRILNEPHLFLPGISDWLAHQIISADDRTWLLTRLGYLIGELLITGYGGAWFLNEIEGSRYFGRYVVGQFVSLANARLQVDPFEVASDAISIPSQSLSALMTEVCHDLETAPAC